jgi:hypothetical protein
LAFAALIASRKVQPLAAVEHKPSSASAGVLTTKVIGAARAAGSTQCQNTRGAANQPANTMSNVATRTRWRERFVLFVIALSPKIFKLLKRLIRHQRRCQPRDTVGLVLSRDYEKETRGAIT